MNIIDYIFPQQCTICSKIGTQLCEVCKKSLQKSLPTCFVCSKISKNYSTHKRCLTKFNLLHFYTGWYLDKRLEKTLNIYKENEIYSFYLSLMFDLVKEKNLETLIQYSKVLPLESENSTENFLNRYLATELSKHFTNKENAKTLLVGCLPTTCKYLTRQLNSISNKEINCLTIFKEVQTHLQ